MPNNILLIISVIVPLLILYYSISKSLFYANKYISYASDPEVVKETLDSITKLPDEDDTESDSDVFNKVKLDAFNLFILHMLFSIFILLVIITLILILNK